MQEESHFLVLEMMLLLVNCHFYQAKKSHTILLVLLLLMEYTRGLLLILVFTLILQLEPKCLILVHQVRGFQGMERQRPLGLHGRTKLKSTSPTNIDIGYKPSGLKWQGKNAVTTSQLQQMRAIFRKWNLQEVVHLENLK